MIELQPLLHKHQKKKIWRKPLPKNCPSFEFLISKKTPSSPDTHLNEKTQIPTRSDSKHYQNIPHLTAELDRVCNNKKTILLTKALSQRQKLL